MKPVSLNPALKPLALPLLVLHARVNRLWERLTAIPAPRDYDSLEAMVLREAQREAAQHLAAVNSLRCFQDVDLAREAAQELLTSHRSLLARTRQ